MRVREALLALLNLGADNRWHKNIDDTLELLVVFMLAILGHKVHFAADFIPVRVVNPQEKVCDDAKGHPCELQVLLYDLLLRLVLLLDDG